MKAQVKETKRRYYIRMGESLYLLRKRAGSKIEQITELPDSVGSYGWVNVDGQETAEGVYEQYRLDQAAENVLRKEESEIMKREAEEQQAKAWAALEQLEVIPATVENIRTILEHLHQQNWGTWSLPKMSIGYAAHQHDCDGVTATTITLDRPISEPGWWIENETKFKVGGKPSYLIAYRTLK